MPMSETEVHKTQALWYAWGHLDAGATLPGDVFDFAHQYQERYAAYRDERTFYMFSMMDAFAKWRRGESLMADVIEREIKRRLEYLRGEIEAERISYGEIAELESLAPYIEDSDVLLLQWAGVPEHPTDTA